MTTQRNARAVAAAPGEETYRNEPAHYTPAACPRFDRCTAAICPLDPDWRLRHHAKGDRVCLILREQAKHGPVADSEGSLPWYVASAIAQATPDVYARWEPLKKAVDRASTTGSRIASARRLAEVRHG